VYDVVFLCSAGVIEVVCVALIGQEFNHSHFVLRRVAESFGIIVSVVVGFL
jgi:uncharacterized membrane protein YraQ (UPF0718 family)